MQAAANALDAARGELTAANELDLAAGRANGLEPALLERLALTPARIDGMIAGPATGRGAARSGRCDSRYELSSVGYPVGTDARTAGRDRDHLRIAT